MADAEGNFAKILSYYGEDQVNSEDFFGILYRFHTALHGVCRKRGGRDRRKRMEKRIDLVNFINLSRQAYDENTRKRESEQRTALMAEKRRLVFCSPLLFYSLLTSLRFSFFFFLPFLL